MRDIRFRAKRKDNGRWVHGDLIHNVDGTVCINKLKDEQYVNIFEVVDPETLGQYTGVEDSDGKPIYEGDIIVSKFTGKEHFVIVCIDGSFYGQNGCGEDFLNHYSNRVYLSEFKRVSIPNPKLAELNKLQKDYTPRKYPDHFPFKVVGNIYDKPELMINNL